MAKIGQAVQRARDELGLSRATLAQQADLPEQELAELEAGTRISGASALMRLARAMGLAPTVFLSDASATSAKPAVNRAKFFHATGAPYLSEADVVALAREVTRAQVFAELATVKVKLDDYEPREPGGQPWRNGYDLAQSLRSKLGLPTEPIRNLQRVLEDNLGVLVVKHAFADTQLRAMAIRSLGGRLIVVSSRLPTPLLRISLAHDLCHHLCDLAPDESYGDADDVEAHSGRESAEEQRAKAFAVMFLAPSTLVRKRFGQPAHQFVTTSRAVDAARAVASECGIGATAALWHLFHLEYLSDREDDVQLWQRHVGGTPQVDAFEQSFGDHDGLARSIERALATDEIEGDQAERLRRL